jgi:S-adenosylmethionine decarboxylase
MRKKVFSKTKERTLSPVVGKHVFGNLYDVEDRYLKDVDFVKKTVTEAASIGNMHIIDLSQAV